MKTSDYRKIQLYLSDNRSNTWRGNLSRILSSATSGGREPSNGYSRTMLFNSVLSQTDVDNNVDLLMVNAPKSPVTKNTWSEPVSTFMNSLTSGGSKLLGTISSLASFGINILSSWNDVFSNNSNTNGRTAQVFQPWTTGVRAWTGAGGGVTFEYEFKFNMGQYGLWSAKEEVVKPILNLVVPAFPQYMNNLGMAGPFPSTSELLLRLIKNEYEDLATQINEGYSISNLKEDVTGYIDKWKNEFAENGSISGVILGGLDDIASIFRNLVESTYRNLTYTIEFGNIIRFDKMIIEQATTSFSNETDQYGFPISGSAKLTFSGLVPLALVNDTGYGATQMFSNTPKEVRH